MPAEQLILAIDTSSGYCAAALLRGPTVIDARREDMVKGQAERLFPMIAEMLEKYQISWRELTLLGVCTGPGNFTGIRLSVAAVRGLALALGIQAVGTSALQALAYGHPGALTAVLNAPRERYFVQSFDDGKETSKPRILNQIETEREILQTGRLTGHSSTNFSTALDVQIIDTPMIATSIGLRTYHSRNIPSPRPSPLYLAAVDAAPSKHPSPVLLA